MIANAVGKAAKMPMPPMTSQVSFPSHTGATEAIIALRASSSGARGKRMPTPRSNPSSSTYMKTLSARITVQIGTRSRYIVSRRGYRRSICLRRCRQRPGRAPVERERRQLVGYAAPREPHEVVHAGAEDERINDDVYGKRGEHVCTGEARRHRFGRAQMAVYDPRLAARLGRDPAAGYGD